MGSRSGGLGVGWSKDGGWVGLGGGRGDDKLGMTLMQLVSSCLYV